MNVWVFLGSRRLTALLDSGSSKTFINTRVAEELRIPLYPDQALKVTVGNGDQVHSPGRLAEVRGMVGGDYFWFDSHSLPMGSLDMVIGVSWMSQLGDISWNLREQTFAFRVADEDYVVRHQQTGSCISSVYIHQGRPTLAGITPGISESFC